MMDGTTLCSSGSRGLELRFQFGFAGGYRNHGRAFCCAQRFAKVPCGKQMVGEVTPAQEQDVDVAGELAVLKAIVEKMQTET